VIPLVCLLLAAHGGEIERLTAEVAASGQAIELAIPVSERVNPRPLIAPGAPPLLSFRYYEGQKRHRFNDTELVLDDAGH
jgi:hypothetical protein